ncbi:MAG: ABC transporter permease [Pseudomonadota bacterium]
MLGYYFRLAAISIRGNWVLSALMIAAIGLGIGVCMTIVTVNYVMGSDPIPNKSGQLLYVQVDSWDPNSPFDEPNEPPDQLTYTDAMALMAAARAPRQVASVGASYVVEPDDRDIKPFTASGRATHADFFPMFEVPFLFGSGWSQQADEQRELVAVLSRRTNDRLFGGENSVGRSVRLGGHLFQVIGVMDEWRPMPRFYDVTTGPFNQVEEIFVPFNVLIDLRLSRSGNTNCWKPNDESGFEAFLASECIWVQMWVELPDAVARAQYLAFLDDYVRDQKTLGRFPRPLNNRLSDVNDWLANQEVVQEEARIMLVVAILFLAVCLLNTIGLLLSKFLGKAPEIGLRRALGASKRALFAQYLVESACIGIVGGILGLALTWLGLQGLVLLLGNLVEPFVQLDWVMVTSAIVLAVLASIAAGLYPTWRASNIAPALQLKSQ